MPRVGFGRTIPVFERTKTIHALDRAATVIGSAAVYALILGHVDRHNLHTRLSLSLYETLSYIVQDSFFIRVSCVLNRHFVKNRRCLLRLIGER
jgi:hypothetical protein